MLSRAEFLHLAGYTALLNDLQSHGESTGQRISFGYQESHDVSAALKLLRTRLPDERIGVIYVAGYVRSPTAQAVPAR